MCGIAGIFAYRDCANPPEPKELLRIRDHMAARGPDWAGVWYSTDGRIGLAHRRLAILDLSDAGSQPMSNQDGRFVVTFNGEIYNYRELRRSLEANGHVFRSRSDTEVLLHLYADEGERMLHRLRGMFAFAIWDVVRAQLFLARDPYGIKPLYYSDDGRAFRFASQVKALVAGGGISTDPDPAGQVGFCLWGSVPDPFTMYGAIRALPAGCSAVVSRAGLKGPSRYQSVAALYRAAQAAAPAVPPAGEAREQVRQALLDSVRNHLVADVPVGGFLSSGIDSGALVGLMRDAGQNQIQTVTLAFEEFRGREDDEAPVAAQLARHYETRHVTRVVTKREFDADLPRILDAMDQPSIDGINTWFVSKAAHELGLKVAVSGLGGDELFGGYPSFRDIPKWVARLALPARLPAVGRALRWTLCATGLDKLARSPKAAGILEYGGTFAGAYLLRRGMFMPWELDQVLDRETIRRGWAALRPLAGVEETITPRPASAFATVAVLESAWYMRHQLLRDTDWASMAHSLEVRVPLVDVTLLAKVAPLAALEFGGAAKAALASAPRRPLPAAVVERAKTGFGVPTEAWMRQECKPRLGSARAPWVSNGLTSRQWSRRILAGIAA
jgi:asparagine synthase (glutamine-hydrolysing)